MSGSSIYSLSLATSGQWSIDTVNGSTSAHWEDITGGGVSYYAAYVDDYWKLESNSATYHAKDPKQAGDLLFSIAGSGLLGGSAALSNVIPNTQSSIVTLSSPQLNQTEGADLKLTNGSDDYNYTLSIAGIYGGS